MTTATSGQAPPSTGATEATERESVIRIRGLRKSFGDLHVLRGVDLDLYRGENLVVLGRSGTGKSVLIKIIVGLLAPDAGEVHVLGQPVHKLTHRQLNQLRVRVGFSFQHSALYDSMSVQDNLEFPLRMNDPKIKDAEVAERVTEVLEAVGLETARRQWPSSLSGGQRKRIGIARTLILKPEIMLYDEPTAGLDPTTSAEINELIVEVQERYRTSSIVITHDLTCAQVVSDRVAMLMEGEFLRVGSFEEVFATDDARVRSFYDYNFVQQRDGI